MEQSPSWETTRLSASQEIPPLLRNPKVHYSNHNCPSPVPVLSQLDPVHTPHIQLPEDPSSYYTSIYAWVSQVAHSLYLLTCLLTHSMEQGPSWETTRLSASQEIPPLLWNPKVHYRIHNCPSPVPVLSQLDPVHTATSNFLKIHFLIILPSTPGSPQWSLSLSFPHQNPVYASPLIHTPYMFRPFNSSWKYR